MTEIEFMHSFSNLKYIDIFDHIEDTIFMIKRNRAIYTNSWSIFKKEYNK